MHKPLLILLLLALLFGLCACRQNTPSHISKPVPTDVTTPTGTPDDLIADHGQLIGRAESPEDAQSIADLYGITLVDYSHGAAVFHTEEDPKAVIQRGKENGWPELTLNLIAKPF